MKYIDRLVMSVWKYLTRLPRTMDQTQTYPGRPFRSWF